MNHGISPLQVQALSALSEQGIIADVAFIAGVTEILET